MEISLEKKVCTAALVIFFLTLTFLSGATATAGTYTTNFPLSENPISEGGKWINGGTTGLDWYNVRTDGTHAHGNTTTGSYTDPTAILTGTWNPNQSAQATVYSINPTTSYYQEVELRLRTTITAHSITGYEILFRAIKTSDAYMQIVRWNGPVGNFTYLAGYGGAQYGVQTGDVVKATINGSTINVYVNGVLMGTANDGTYTTGNPGIGFNYGCGSTYSDFGFSSFTASDGADTSIPSPPTNLH